MRPRILAVGLAISIFIWALIAFVVYLIVNYL